MESSFHLPEESLLQAINQAYPCREAQVCALATLLHPTAAPCKNLVIHGAEATGKSDVTEAVLERLARAAELQYAVVNSIECITGRHLLERALGRVADALEWENKSSRCETLAQFPVELSRILSHTQRPAAFRFVLVFDAIDRQREAPPTLLPALARLADIIPCLTTVFIVTAPAASLLRTSSVPYVYFPNYTKSDLVAILALESPPPVPTTTAQETTDLWSRFTAAVHDALTRAAARTLPAHRHACLALWPRFTAPIAAGTHGPREFSRLLVAARVHFQDEALLDPGLLVQRARTPAPPPPPPPAGAQTHPSQGQRAPAPVAAPPKPASQVDDLAALLPTTARLLLLAAYLASHNAPRHDLALFSTFHHGRRRRRGGALSVPGAGTPGRRRAGGPRSKHRKIARKLLGAHAFVLERMLAIFSAVRREWCGGLGAKRAQKQQDEDAEEEGWEGGEQTGATLDVDVGMAIATLASLRLLIRAGAGTGGGDLMDRGGKWRVNVGWEVVRALGRGMGVEIEEWLVE